MKKSEAISKLVKELEENIESIDSGDREFVAKLMLNSLLDLGMIPPARTKTFITKDFYGDDREAFTIVHDWENE